jgi:hypothetical protein
MQAGNSPSIRAACLLLPHPEGEVTQVNARCLGPHEETPSGGE